MQDGVERVILQFLAHLQVERSLSAHTIAAYRRDLRHYQRYLASCCGAPKLSEVDTAQVAAFVDYLRGYNSNLNLAPASVARVLAAVRGLHKFAFEEGLVSVDVAHEVKPPKLGQPLPKALQVDEVQRLLDAASQGSDPVSVRDSALLEILYGTGARVSEAVNLSLDDLDLSGAQIRLFGKGSKERVLPLGSYAIAAVEKYLTQARPLLLAKASNARAQRGSDSPKRSPKGRTRAEQVQSPLFFNQRGRQLSRQSAWEIIQIYANRAGLEHVTPHTLRHSFATHLLQGGADIRVVQEMLGHASVTTTQIYTKVTPDTLREIYATAHPRAR